MAINLIKRERDEAKDPALRKMLDKRVARLNGLQVLRDAQVAFEKRFNRPLAQPQELLDSGFLDDFPADPLKLGYEFHEHTFHLKQMQIE